MKAFHFARNHSFQIDQLSFRPENKFIEDNTDVNNPEERIRSPGFCVRIPGPRDGR